MSNSLACSHSLLMHQKRMNYLHGDNADGFRGVDGFLFSRRTFSEWLRLPPVNAPTCACLRTDLSPPVFLVIPKLLCPIALIAERSGRAASVTSCYWQQRAVREWSRQKQVALPRSWPPKLHLHMSHLSSHDPIISPSIETSPNRTSLIAPAPPISPPSHNVILRNVETIQPPFDFGGQNDYQIGRPLCWCACASVREEGKLDRVCEEFPLEIPLRDSRGCVIHFLSSWQIDHVHLTASWVISRHVGFNTPLGNRRKKNNFGEEKS